MVSNLVAPRLSHSTSDMHYRKPLYRKKSVFKNGSGFERFSFQAAGGLFSEPVGGRQWTSLGVDLCIV